MTLGACVLGGCLGAPETEELWTRVDVVSSEPVPRQTLAPGTTSITVRTTVTYRSVLTGFAVAELRASDSLGTGALAMAPDAPRVAMAEQIDVLLQHSRSLGRSTRAVTGWDHLVQPIDFTFAASSAGVTPGSRLFLVCYLGSGMRVEQPSGADSIVITPFVSSQHRVLPVGMELYVEAP